MVQSEDDEPPTRGSRAFASLEATKERASFPTRIHNEDINYGRIFLWRAVQAVGATLLLAAIPRQFDVSPGQPCSKFPICDPRTLQPPIPLPPAFHRFYTCETLLLVLTLSTFVHWLCVFDLFQQPRWSDRYLSATVYTTVVALIPAAFFVGDPVTVFLQILPAVTDVCLVFCVLLDILHV